MKFVLLCWAITASLALVLVLMLNLQPPCTATAEEMKAAEVACNKEVRFWITSQSSVYNTLKACRNDLAIKDQNP
jgi:hypothetical protein